MDRRNFLQLLGAGTTWIGSSAWAADAKASTQKKKRAPTPQGMGVLVDTTLCEGCQSCEEACAEANGLPAPEMEEDTLTQARNTSTTQWSVINRHKTSRGEVFAKRQCMHCLQPACASACLTKAMLKTKEGPVVWNEAQCMGCRFCMVSCPFDVPKFEYDSPLPRIQKCRLCWERLKKGQKPACVEECPNEALVFGERRLLLEEARRRIYTQPKKYVSHIYGEHEVGGTSWLYLSAVPFEELGFRMDLGTIPYPVYTKEFLYAVPVVLTLWPAFLIALRRATLQERGNEDEGKVGESR
jgi:formate dehydrogenase iron-sulfur subunit